MYQPSHFQVTDAATILELLADSPLATVVRGGGAQPLQADLVPLRVTAQDGAGPRVLAGHVARANPLWREADGAEVLLLFHGAQAYVSPGFYASKAEHGKVVPTWNYATVQVRGRLRAVDDAAWLGDFLRGLTATHEAGRDAPWAVDDAPADFIAATMRAIVGIEVEVSAVEAKFKMSQNRPEADRDGVERGLDEDGRAGRQPGNQPAGAADWVHRLDPRRTGG